jgi:hypothetical protein
MKSMNLSRLFLYATLPALIASVWGGGCDASNAVVGGECLAGLSECKGDCFDLKADAEHCGSCDVRCGRGIACIDGFCGGRPPVVDGSIPDAQPDGTISDARNDSDVACMPPFNTESQCGDCNTKCKSGEACLIRDGGFACGPPCTPPLVPCEGKCVDTQIDPENCGICGKFCVSFLCGTGVCQGSNPGQIVAMGHDYQGVLGGTSQARVLLNAAFIPRSNPLQILSYERDSNLTAVQNVKSIISNNAAGRMVNFTVSKNEVDLTANTLSTRFDVIVIYDQENRSPAALDADGASWNASLARFLSKGGVVIVLDGAAGQGGMPRLLTSSGLLNTPSHTPLASFAPVTAVAPLDVVATQVISPYAAFPKSAALNTLEPSIGNVTWVVREGAGSGSPVVIHKVVP